MTGLDKWEIGRAYVALMLSFNAALSVHWPALADRDMLENSLPLCSSCLVGGFLKPQNPWLLIKPPLVVEDKLFSQVTRPVCT